MNFFDNLDKAFESKVRLGVMAILVVNEWVSYTDLKEALNLTDGNLASHLSALEKMGYIRVKKEFVGKKPKTSYRVSDEGNTAFERHLKALEGLIKRM